MVVNDVVKLFGLVDGERILEKYFNYKKIDVFINGQKEIEKEIEEKILKDYKLYKNGIFTEEIFMLVKKFLSLDMKPRF